MPCWSAAWEESSRDTAERKPMRRSLLDCCAGAARGHATTEPPSVDKNCRRRMWIAMRPSGGGHAHATEGRYHALIARSGATFMHPGLVRLLSNTLRECGHSRTTLSANTGCEQVQQMRCSI